MQLSTPQLPRLKTNISANVSYVICQNRSQVESLQSTLKSQRTSDHCHENSDDFLCQKLLDVPLKLLRLKVKSVIESLVKFSSRVQQIGISCKKIDGHLHEIFVAQCKQTALLKLVQKME